MSTEVGSVFVPDLEQDVVPDQIQSLLLPSNSAWSPALDAERADHDSKIEQFANEYLDQSINIEAPDRDVASAETIRTHRDRLFDMRTEATRRRLSIAADAVELAKKNLALRTNVIDELQADVTKALKTAERHVRALGYTEETGTIPSTQLRSRAAGVQFQNAIAHCPIVMTAKRSVLQAEGMRDNATRLLHSLEAAHAAIAFELADFCS